MSWANEEFHMFLFKAWTGTMLVAKNNLAMKNNKKVLYYANKKKLTLNNDENLVHELSPA